MVAFHEGFALVMHGDVKVSVMHGDVNGRYVPAKVSSMLMGTILMKLPKIATNAMFGDCPIDLALKSAAGASH